MPLCPPSIFVCLLPFQVFLIISHLQLFSNIQVCVLCHILNFPISLHHITVHNVSGNSKDAKVVTFEQCDGFLCSGGGDCSLAMSSSQKFLAPSLTITSLVHIVAVVGSQQDLAAVLISALEKYSDSWGSCLDRREVRQFRTIHDYLKLNCSMFWIIQHDLR